MDAQSAARGLAAVGGLATVDLLDRAAVERAVAKTRRTQLYHLAGFTHVGNAWASTGTTLQVNVIGTHHLLEALRRRRPDARVLITGTGARLPCRPSSR